MLKYRIGTILYIFLAFFALWNGWLECSFCCRILVVNIVSIGWNCYMAWISEKEHEDVVLHHHEPDADQRVASPSAPLSPHRSATCSKKESWKSPALLHNMWFLSRFVVHYPFIIGYVGVWKKASENIYQY